jgi:hypothetical protein
MTTHSVTNNSNANLKVEDTDKGIPLRRFLSIFGSLTLGVVTGCKEQAEVGDDIPTYLENFPKNVKGAESILVHPCEDAKAVMIHIRQRHGTQLSPETPIEVRKIQSNITSIAAQLNRDYGLSHFIIEGFDIPGLNTMTDTLAKISSGTNYPGRTAEERQKAFFRSYPSQVNFRPSEYRILSMMVDPNYTLVPVKDNFPSGLRDTHDRLMRDIGELKQAYAYCEAYADFTLSTDVDNLAVEVENRFPETKKVQQWIDDNGERIKQRMREFQEKVSSKDDAIFAAREDGVIEAIRDFSRVSPNVRIYGCIYGARHSFVEKACEAGIAVIEITPIGVNARP